MFSVPYQPKKPEFLALIINSKQHNGRSVNNRVMIITMFGQVLGMHTEDLATTEREELQDKNPNQKP